MRDPIESIIPRGRENAISLKALAQITGISERRVRIKMEAARKRGVIILNFQDGRGYFQSEDIEDIQKQFEANERRTKSIQAQQRFLRIRLMKAGRL